MFKTDWQYCNCYCLNETTKKGTQNVETIRTEILGNIYSI